MKSKYADRFAAGAAYYLEPGARKQQRSIAAADEAGLVIDNPMALVLTSQRC